jgi:DNA-binding MarR family transcriptional regulator
MRRDILLELESRLGAGLGADAKRAGLLEAVARVLLVLAPGDRVAMNEIARRLRRDPSTATRFVDAATRRDLVQRVPGVDRRRRIVSLTPEGEVARARLAALREARAREIPEAVRSLIGLGPDAATWFLEALVEATRP